MKGKRINFNPNIFCTSSPLANTLDMLINQGVDVLEVVGVGVFTGKNDYALARLPQCRSNAINLHHNGIIIIIIIIILLLFVLNLTDTKSTCGVTICLHKLLNALVACYTKAKYFVTCAKR